MNLEYFELTCSEFFNQIYNQRTMVNALYRRKLGFTTFESAFLNFIKHRFHCNFFLIFSCKNERTTVLKKNPPDKLAI